MKTRSSGVPFAPDRCPFFYGWIILPVGALGALMSVPGQTVGVSVFIEHLMEALNLSRDQISAAYMFGTVCSALLLTYAGRIYDRLGARVTSLIAAVGLGVVLVYLSFSDKIAARIGDLLNINGASVAFGVVFAGFFGLRFWG